MAQVMIKEFCDPNKVTKGGHNLHHHAMIFMKKIKLTEFQNSFYLLNPSFKGQ